MKTSIGNVSEAGNGATDRVGRIAAGLTAALILVAGALCRPPSLAAQVEAQVFFGSAASLPLPMTIRQNGQPDLHFTAHWATRPTRPTWYYAWRVGYWNGNRAWRLDHTHHKIYLTRRPPEVTDFRITNGFNIVSVSRAFRTGRFTWSAGAGPVITYSYSTVRGKVDNQDHGVNGYTLAGGSLIGMATREFPLISRLVLSLDGRLSASYVSVPIRDGRARLPNVAAHLHAGLGWSIGAGGRR
jgi:hypothetical protein